MKKHIPLYDCVDKGHYIISARNFSHGIYQKEAQGFVGIRTKFGDKFLDIEYHYDTGSPHGTAIPFKLLEVVDEKDMVGDWAFKWLEEHRPEENWRDV